MFCSHSVLYAQVRYQVAQPQSLVGPPVAVAAVAPMYASEIASSGQPRRQLPPRQGLPMPGAPNNKFSPFEQMNSSNGTTSSQVHPLNGGAGNDGTGGGGGAKDVGGVGSVGYEGGVSSACARADPRDGQERQKQTQL